MIRFTVVTRKLALTDETYKARVMPNARKSPIDSQFPVFDPCRWLIAAQLVANRPVGSRNLLISLAAVASSVPRREILCSELDLKGYFHFSA
ncbi:hypothetical protein A6X21_00275 [Planctopirus hydrillae]|uniref:Uncharacterized protein n=1 Tax=Planctopirus hydrillae TaxID=1841610 RepID=A0A1C3EAV3_9PLAN|nr:hypothetical protein A6X21_00275 [Planctopirus hydrillae]